MKYELFFAHIVAWCALLVLSERVESPVAEVLFTAWAAAHVLRAGFVMARPEAK
jgi:hypothetical protein